MKAKRALFIELSVRVRGLKLLPTAANHRIANIQTAVPEVARVKSRQHPSGRCQSRIIGPAANSKITFGKFDKEALKHDK